MTTLMYALSIMPMIMITLVVHELGHLTLARLNKAKVVGFQIGIGWRIITCRTGKTVIRLTPATEMLNPAAEELRPGDTASVYVTRRPGEKDYAAVGILTGDRTGIPAEQWEKVSHYNKEYMHLNGKVRETNKERIILADMHWSLRIFPIAAGVTIQDDPHRSMPEAYNAMPWPKQASITLAGPASNIMLMIVALAFVAIFPISVVNAPVWTVTQVDPNGPAQQAGLRAGDRIVAVNNLLHPNVNEMKEQVNRASATEKELSIEVLRNGRNATLRVRPEPGTGWLGIRMEHNEATGTRYEMTPNAAGQRVLNMGESYLSVLADLLTTLHGDPEERMDAISGPVMGTYQTVQTVEYAGLHGWLIILATLNLGVTVTNMLPIPPMDGYRIVSEGVQALRGGQPTNPKLERAIVAGGIALLFTAGVYLMLHDVNRLMG